MRPVHRWSLAALATLLVLVTPYVGRARPAQDPDVATADLVALVRSSAAAPYSGSVEVQGRLGLPIDDHFTDLADLFGGHTRLRVWWRGSDDWRVDRLLETGEVDLFHHGERTTEWSYERRVARVSVDPGIRLPRDSDLLPPQVARRALEGVANRDVTRLPPRRVADVDAAGLRLEIADPRSTIRRVDLWVEPDTGVALAVEVYGAESEPAVRTAFTAYAEGSPDQEVTRFRPAAGVSVFRYAVLDVAEAADRFGFARAPATVGGLVRTAGRSAAVYGTGLTRLLALPLPSDAAHDLACRLSEQGARRVRGQPVFRVGALGATVSRDTGQRGVRWLVSGTVTDEALLDATAALAGEAGSR
jgi:hypothetical protein